MRDSSRDSFQSGTHAQLQNERNIVVLSFDVEMPLADIVYLPLVEVD